LGGLTKLNPMPTNPKNKAPPPLERNGPNAGVAKLAISKPSPMTARAIPATSCMTKTPLAAKLRGVYWNDGKNYTPVFTFGERDKFCEIVTPESLTGAQASLLAGRRGKRDVRYHSTCALMVCEKITNKR
jgi:hypothetical protein